MHCRDVEIELTTTNNGLELEEETRSMLNPQQIQNGGQTAASRNRGGSEANSDSGTNNTKLDEETKQV